jgi:hypothetical protein
VRRRRCFLLATGLSISPALAIAACVEEPRPNPLVVADEPDSGRERKNTREIPDGADPFLPDGGKPPGRIYAHTARQLFRYDPLANTLVLLGEFDCVPTGGSFSTDDSVIDIALDRTGQMYGTTFYRFIKIDPTNGSCQILKEQTLANRYPNSLSFVPIGTVDDAEEALVGYGYDAKGDARIYTRIDLTTGEPTTFGDINPTPPLGGITYGLAGDFISLSRNQATTYGAIKRVGDGGTEDNFLAELDPVTGKVKAIIGDTNQALFYGLGFWAGKAYGFSSTGGIYAIDMKTGAATLALQAEADGGPIVWYGAGVTTDTPTTP